MILQTTQTIRARDSAPVNYVVNRGEGAAFAVYHWMLTLLTRGPPSGLPTLEGHPGTLRVHTPSPG